MSSDICTSDYFNRVIGLIEDIVVSDEFQAVQRNFMENHYTIFDFGEENKHEYTTIFAEYTDTMEALIVSHLNLAMDGQFDMDRFANELRTLKDVVDGEIFELLFSLSDFVMFKEMMLDYKSFKEGAFGDMSSGIVVKQIKSGDNL